MILRIHGITTDRHHYTIPSRAMFERLFRQMSDQYRDNYDGITPRMDLNRLNDSNKAFSALSSCVPETDFKNDTKKYVLSVINYLIND